ncbi:MAG: tyrosine--tRNA ligase, partial [Candidatus Veblenbacteria bacterium]|nr:tyrosine--tRNA ligase [Candidatus Veblenbacteria bacterium]
MPTERNILAATEELLSRGVTEVVVKKHLAERLRSGKKLRVKLGIDPTGPKVHLGRAIPLWKLRAFQDLGHQAVLIVGDFTAQVGDPSDKLSKRPMLTSEKIKQNMATYQVQLGKILDMPKVEWRYNSEWLTKLSFLEIARLAESFSLQQMLARRNFKERLGKQDDISLRELMYPLMQGYDSVAVQADVEIGGFDQLFNLLAGRKIQEHYGKEQQDILTTQMLEGTDGRKMSTSWGNVVTIVDEPNEMFGKLMAVKDELVPKYLLLCTRLPEAEVKQVSKSMKGAGAKAAKVRMASEVVTLYHSAKAAQ